MGSGRPVPPGQEPRVLLPVPPPCRADPGWARPCLRREASFATFEGVAPAPPAAIATAALAGLGRPTTRLLAAPSWTPDLAAARRLARLPATSLPAAAASPLLPERFAAGLPSARPPRTTASALAGRGPGRPGIAHRPGCLPEIRLPPSHLALELASQLNVPAPVALNLVRHVERLVRPPQVLPGRLHLLPTFWPQLGSNPKLPPLPSHVRPQNPHLNLGKTLIPEHTTLSRTHHLLQTLGTLASKTPTSHNIAKCVLETFRCKLF
jgi:hypothetical protein